MTAKGKLPKDFPHREELAAADINTFPQLRALKGDYSQIEHIGASKGGEIDAALAAADTEKDRDTDATVNDPAVDPSSPYFVGENKGAPADVGPADVKTEAEARNQAINPEAKHAADESFGAKLANSRFCFYDDPEGPFVADADTIEKDSQRMKVLPISIVTPRKGMEVYDGEDHYALTEDMGVTNFGEPSDWLKVRSPTTGLALIR